MALHYATDYPIDVAIIDLGLPDMDGLQLISRLREQQIPFPIIVLTAPGQLAGQGGRAGSRCR